ncbi:hypothetical protein PPACK8108_LOCUS22378 [Phakopsora pachyrhizi]|uniref:Uncharacterized protein n=1 Tax=Phakopsora pachyrhizi TaxID=170000 RepID=A0AAV0BM72_PHAPC|nr:hypothetical protein PPACK8108_LOCUS22378 [Phakopsora pachyrhizi]
MNYDGIETEGPNDDLKSSIHASDFFDSDPDPSTSGGFAASAYELVKSSDLSSDDSGSPLSLKTEISSTQGFCIDHIQDDSNHEGESAVDKFDWLFISHLPSSFLTYQPSNFYNAVGVDSALSRLSPCNPRSWQLNVSIVNTRKTTYRPEKQVLYVMYRNSAPIPTAHLAQLVRASVLKAEVPARGSVGVDSALSRLSPCNPRSWQLNVSIVNTRKTTYRPEKQVLYVMYRNSAPIPTAHLAQLVRASVLKAEVPATRSIAVSIPHCPQSVATTSSTNSGRVKAAVCSNALSLAAPSPHSLKPPRLRTKSLKHTSSDPNIGDDQRPQLRLQHQASSSQVQSPSWFTAKRFCCRSEDKPEIWQTYIWQLWHLALIVVDGDIFLCSFFQLEKQIGVKDFETSE